MMRKERTGKPTSLVRRPIPEIFVINQQGGSIMKTTTPIWSTALFTLILVGLLVPGGLLAKNYEDKKVEFTETFPIADCNFLTTGSNPYFKLIEGRELHYDNMQCFNDGECDELEQLVITVLPDLEPISFGYTDMQGNPVNINLMARVVEEFETADGEEVETSRNFFAECEATQDVYYFGEDVVVADGSNPGQWKAGVDDALPGIIFPGGAFLLGARYFQEIAPNAEALDRAEHVEMGQEITVPAGTFQNCVSIDETTPLDKHELSEKDYCYDVGLVTDGDLELVNIIP